MVERSTNHSLAAPSQLAQFPKRPPGKILLSDESEQGGAILRRLPYPSSSAEPWERGQNRPTRGLPKVGQEIDGSSYLRWGLGDAPVAVM